jgi:pimeloyl-ACP methyl ester carboxylesterase
VAAQWWPLAVLAALAIGIAVGGLVPRWPGLAHLVALPPLDLAVDLRLLVARAPSYPALLLGAALSVSIRTLLLGTLLFTIGRAHSFGSGTVRALKLYLAALVPLAIAAGLEFAGLAAVYAWYALAGLALTMVTALWLAPRALAPRGSRLRGVPIVLASVLALLVVGGVAKLTGTWGAVLTVVASAGLTAATLVFLGSERAPPRSSTPAVALLVAFTAMAPLHGSPSGQVAPNATLLVVPGVDTSSGRGVAYRLDVEGIGFPCDRVFYFSYRGPGEGAPSGEAPCPIRLHRAYAEPSTQRPLAELVEMFALQVEEIQLATGDAPLVVVTHSQGGAIAWQAVAEGRAPNVSHLIALAGFPHSPVAYPAPGEDGPGRAGADVLRVLSWFSRFLGTGTFDPDAPLARELLARSNGLEDVFAQPLPAGVSTASLFATMDLVVAPEGHEFPATPATMVDTTHVGVVGSAAAELAIREILAGEETSSTSVAGAVLDAALPAFLPPAA